MSILEGNFSEKGAFLRNPADGSLLVGFGGQFDVVKNFRPDSREVFYLKDFYADTYLRYIPETILRLTPSEQEELLKTPAPTGIQFQSVGTEDHIYQEDFRDLLKSFSGTLRKVV